MDHLKIDYIPRQITIYFPRITSKPSIQKRDIPIFNLEHFLEDNEKLYLSKICPNFVVSAVIRGNDYEKKQVPSLVSSKI